MMRVLSFLVVLALASLASAQTSPAAGGEAPIDWQGDLSMDEYLFALGEISPAAREGANAYLQAFARRCGRALTVIELRRRVADGDGDPVLMQMMRSSQLKDHISLQRLSASITCSRRT